MKFSIILPVRNGGSYIKECVNSILAQTHTSFNLLILDNNSSDGTMNWIQSVNDSRVKIFPSGKDLTIEENWQRIVSIPKNEFITLIGHDDLLHREYLAGMNELIMSHPGASLYQAHFSYINARGEKIRDCKPMAERETAEQFIEKFLQQKTDVMGTGFMMRSKDYDAIGGIPPYPNLLFADFELWMELTHKSYKATTSKPLFSFRIHQSTTTVSPDIKYHQAFDRFVHFLARLSQNDRYGEVIRKNAEAYILFYCRGLSHRLLRTPRSQREGLSVRQFVNRCKNYAVLLGFKESFYPESVFSIRLAIWIDSNSFSRSLFLAFKKIFPKPVLK